MDKKLSGEFAIAVILIVAGTLTYVFWKGAVNISTDTAPTISIKNENGQIGEQKKEEKWKLFRNDYEGYEFSLPEGWKLQDGSGKFVIEGEMEEIRVVIEEADKDISTEKLLMQTMEADDSVYVEPLAEVNGVKIEKVEADVLNQTAKIIQGEDVITLTYLSRSVEQSTDLFDKIIPTFKAVN